MLAPILHELNLVDAAIFFSVLNVLLVGASALLWVIVRWMMPNRRIFERARPITTGDLWMTAGCIAMNVIVSLLGWRVWQLGLLKLSPMTVWGTSWQFTAMLVLMDFGMYVTHRIAHIPWVYFWLHRPHHDHVETNALSLFVLSPLEVLGFGGLMLVSILIVQPSEAALTMYLSLNLVVGTLGHTGVKFIAPNSRWRAGLEPWDTSEFHARHHTERDCNFGFYSPLWDKLFGTWGHVDSKPS